MKLAKSSLILQYRAETFLGAIHATYVAFYFAGANAAAPATSADTAVSVVATDAVSAASSSPPLSSQSALLLQLPLLPLPLFFASSSLCTSSRTYRIRQSFSTVRATNRELE